MLLIFILQVVADNFTGAFRRGSPGNPYCCDNDGIEIAGEEQLPEKKEAHHWQERLIKIFKDIN